MSVTEYEQNAATCLSLAEQVSDPRNKASLIAMAGAWLRLAAQAAKNQTIYATVLEPQPQPMQQQQTKSEDD